MKLRVPPVEIMMLARRHPGLWLALLTYLVLAGGYFFIVPIFEGPDEWTHTGHVKYIAEGNGLPVMLPGQGIWGGQQPPLYYALGAALVQPFNLDGVQEYEDNRRNPHASLGYALDPGNKNNYLHTPAESFPYNGLSLTVHLLRLYSMGYGVVALIFIYLTAFELAQSTGADAEAKFFATSVALLVAAQPMFAFITASVANEPANIALSAVGLWLAQRYVLRGPAQSWRRAAALGITLGLIALAKMTGLAFGLIAVVAMLMTAVSVRKQPGAARLLWRDGIIIGALFGVVGGWWYWRNYQLYGDFFQQGLYKIYFGVDPQPLSFSQFWYILTRGEISFWATFGWLNIAAPEWVYSFYRIVSRVGVLGVFIAMLMTLVVRFLLTIRPSAKIPPVLVLHLLFPVTLAFSLARLVATEGGMQGRQLLPALGAIAIVVLWGWQQLAGPRLRLFVLTTLLAVWVAVAVWLPLGVVAPAYIPRPPLDLADVPANLTRLDWVYGDNEIKLLGVDIGADVVQPGRRVPVTAYWQALSSMEINYSVFVHLMGRDYTDAGQMNTYPALGLRPTTTLQPGQIIADTYPVLVNGGTAAPTRLQVNIGLFDFDEPGRPGIIPAINGVPVDSPTVGHLKLIPVEWPPQSAEFPLAEFADNISLTAASFENCQTQTSNCTLSLTWQANARPAADYTVFVQLWQAGELIAGFDAPPVNNNYPTSLWAAAEIIIDPHPLDLTAVAPGQYRVLAGLYNLQSGQRLPVSVDGIPVPDYALDLGQIQVE
jgi:hypothetical protein